MPAKDSFAVRQLEKHGWNDGKGLGKSENGMKDAIKVKRKNNKGGLGHDHGEAFTFHWWDHVFNKTANSIKVVSEGEDIKIEKDENAKKIQPMLISNKKPLRKCFAGKPLLYGTFVKSGTYQNDEEVKDDTENDDSSSSDEEDFSAKDTLEKTFKMTGLTGHKAARHGHQLGGKLQRVQEQEQKESCSTSKKLSGHKKQEKSCEDAPVCPVSENELSSKKKKKQEHKESCVTNKKLSSHKKQTKSCEDTPESDNELSSKKKRSKSKYQEDVIETSKQNRKRKTEDADIKNSEYVEEKKSKKKKKSKKESNT